MKVRLLQWLLLGLLFSCERQEEADLKVPYKRKLVAAVFIGAGDDVVDASISATSPVFGNTAQNEPQRVTNAVGFVQGENGIYSFIYDSLSRLYTATLAPNLIEAGQTYTVVLSDNHETVRGKTTVPNPIHIDMEMDFDSTMSNDLPVYTAKITYKPSLGQPSAYVRILPLLIMNDSSTFIPMIDPIFKPMELLSSSKSYTGIYNSTASFNGLYPVRINCMIYTCDEAYAQYYNATQGLDFSTIIPGSEPSLVYSNMTNHLGIVASYNVCEQRTLVIK